MELVAEVAPVHILPGRRDEHELIDDVIDEHESEQKTVEVVARAGLELEDSGLGASVRNSSSSSSWGVFCLELGSVAVPGEGAAEAVEVEEGHGERVEERVVVEDDIMDGKHRFIYYLSKDDLPQINVTRFTQDRWNTLNLLACVSWLILGLALTTGVALALGISLIVSHLLMSLVLNNRI